MNGNILLIYLDSQNHFFFADFLLKSVVHEKVNIGSEDALSVILLKFQHFRGELLLYISSLVQAFIAHPQFF